MGLLHERTPEQAESESYGRRASVLKTGHCPTPRARVSSSVDEQSFPIECQMTKGSCGKEPYESERLMHGSESGVGEGIPLLTITGHVAGVQCSRVTGCAEATYPPENGEPSSSP